MLTLLDPDLANIDPHDPNLPEIYKYKVFYEVINNFWYYLSNAKFVPFIAILCCLPIYQWIRTTWMPRRNLENSTFASVLDAGRIAAMVVVFALSLLVSVNSSYNPFIYFNF